MGVLLRHYGTGEFFKGEAAWTPLPKAACGFEDYVKAISEAQKLGLTNVEAVMEERTANCGATSTLISSRDESDLAQGAKKKR
jgi:hypothetical protein